jgi:putative addiction module killer protein
MCILSTGDTRLFCQLLTKLLNLIFEYQHFIALILQHLQPLTITLSLKHTRETRPCSARPRPIAHILLKDLPAHTNTLTICSHKATLSLVIEVRKTADFADWLDQLQDARAKARILIRLRRLGLGNIGDWKPVRDGISELRLDYGPGYRIYFTRRGKTVIILLAGGTKKSQSRDIRRAISLATEL